MGPGFGARSGILTLTIKDKAVLYAAYMPYIRQGGLFIPTQKQYQLGDEVFLLLNLMDEPEKIPVAGKVIYPERRSGEPGGRYRCPVQWMKPRGPRLSPIWPGH